MLFPKGDQEQLKQSILWALNHPQAMQKMAENSVRRVQDFSQEKMVEETLAILENTGSLSG